MTDLARDSALQLIRSNIAQYGCHIYLVAGAAIPRFAYTIGLRGEAGSELVLAGASFYSAVQVKLILNEAAKHIGSAVDSQQYFVELGSLGTFFVRKVDSTWARALMLGAIDYYGQDGISAWQVVPDRDHWTLDVPDLTRPWDARLEPCWRWLHEPWVYPVSARSVATTNLGALRGDRITEAARWEIDQWELFSCAGPDVPRHEVRMVPLGTLLAIDESLADVATLEVGQALWRDAYEGGWQSWG